VRACRSFEGALAALGAPLVGIVAEDWFNFPTDGQTYACRNGKPIGGDQDLVALSSKAHSLGDAMLTCMLFPWVLCLAMYTLLHFTYPKDRRAAAALLARDLSHASLSNQGLIRNTSHRDCNTIQEC
jgi:hypothetical protein